MRTTLLLAVLTASCSSGHGEIDRSQALEISNRYVETHYPATDVSTRTPTVREDENSWYISYDLSPGTWGGSTYITINKRSGDVTNSFAEQ